MGSLLTQGLSVWSLQAWAHLHVLQLPPTAQGRKLYANLMRMCAQIVICLFMLALSGDANGGTDIDVGLQTSVREGESPCVRGG